MIALAIVLLIGYVTTVVKHGSTDLAAYRSGKEAPSIEKFRTRHRAKKDKGERKLTAPAKPGGKEPGPLRQWARAVADNAAAEQIERQTVKSKARREWYRTNAPQREQQWQTKWQARLDAREAKIRRWGERKGVLDPAPPPIAPAEQDQHDQADEVTEPPAPAGPDATTQPQRSRDEIVQAWRDALDRGETVPDVLTAAEWNSLDPATRNDLIKQAEARGVTSIVSKDGVNKPLFTIRTAPTPTTNAPTNTGGTVYEHGVQQLIDSAEQIRRFCDDMASFADALGGRGFGTEITGTATEAGTELAVAADDYADLAEQIQADGDVVRDAHDQTNHQIPDDAAMA